MIQALAIYIYILMKILKLNAVGNITKNSIEIITYLSFFQRSYFISPPAQLSCACIATNLVKHV